MYVYVYILNAEDSLDGMPVILRECMHESMYVLRTCLTARPGDCFKSRMHSLAILHTLQAANMHQQQASTQQPQLYIISPT
jgi:hypothetical protein